MQFIKRENDFSPAFSVWSIEKVTKNLLSNSTKSGHFLQPPALGMLFQFLLPINLQGNELFEFKFYR